MNFHEDTIAAAAADARAQLAAQVKDALKLMRLLVAFGVNLENCKLQGVKQLREDGILSLLDAKNAWEVALEARKQVLGA